MGKYAHAERERFALETFIETHAPDEVTEDVWRLLARRIVDVAKAEIREEIGGRLDVDAARAVPGDVGLMVDLLIDAAAERVRAEVGSEPTPLREGLKPFADASWSYNEAVSRDLARDGKDCHRASQEVFSGTGAEGSGPGCCRHCGAPFELVRPGKSQPVCACWRRYV